MLLFGLLFAALCALCDPGDDSYSTSYDSCSDYEAGSSSDDDYDCSVYYDGFEHYLKKVDRVCYGRGATRYEDQYGKRYIKRDGDNDEIYLESDYENNSDLWW